MHPDIRRGDICSCNAGIIGGSDIDIFQELSRLAFAIANKNDISKLSRNTLLNVNVLLEQVMLHRLLLQQNKKVCTLFDQVFYDFGYTDRDVANFDSAYIHLLGGHKRSRKTCLHMENSLAEKFPHAMDRIASVVPRQATSVFLMSA